MKFLYILLVSISIPISSLTVIYSSTYIDVLNLVEVKKSSIVIDGNKITSIQKGYIDISKEDILIDLRGMTLMPGFMDMHVHFGQEYQSKSKRPVKVERETSAILAAKHALLTLKSGFTTVRQVGDSGFVAISLRDLINGGYIKGPRIFTSGRSIATTGGHADQTNGKNIESYEYPVAEDGVINGPYDAYTAVRQRYKDGADNIKITATGGVMSIAKNGQNPQFTLEEIKSICDTAKDYGMIIAAHAHGDEGIQRAIIGGVTTIEHGTLMSDKSIELMKEYGTYYVPTITAGKEVAEKAKIKGYYDELVVPKALAIGPQIQSTFAKAYKAGVKIAFGSDAGVYPHGINGKEFGYMHEVGMPIMECIQSATITNASILNMENDLGKIKEGFIADIVATEHNPLDNVSTLENVVFVMKEGVIYKN